MMTKTCPDFLRFQPQAYKILRSKQAPLGLATVIKTISVDSHPAAQLTKKENKSGWIELSF